MNKITRQVISLALILAALLSTTAVNVFGQGGYSGAAEMQAPPPPAVCQPVTVTVTVTETVQPTNPPPTRQLQSETQGAPPEELKDCDETEETYDDAPSAPTVNDVRALKSESDKKPADEYEQPTNTYSASSYSGDMSAASTNAALSGSKKFIVLAATVSAVFHLF